MNFALVYLLHRALYRLGDFFYHWYAHGSRNLFHWFLSVLERVDRTIAIRVTLKHFFQPLYKDYTILGRILGVFFRSGRVLIGFFVYALAVGFFALIYLTWVLLPPALLIYVASRL